VKKVALVLMLVGGGIPTLVHASKIEQLRHVPTTYVDPAKGHLPFNIHRGTQTLLSLMLPGTHFNDPEGVACSLLDFQKSFRHPSQDVVITVVGVNSGAGQILYNVGLSAIKKFGSLGEGVDQFRAPQGIAITHQGRIAVADAGNNRIVLLQHNQYRIFWVKALGHLGTHRGEFRFPSGVAFDGSGRLFITDTLNNRIQILLPNGKFVVFPAQGLIHPTGIAIIDKKDVWTFYRSGPWADRIAVIDDNGQRIQIFNFSGQRLYAITASQITSRPSKFIACAFDYYGNLVVTNELQSCLMKFSPTLKFLTSFYGDAQEGNQLNQPRGIAINKQFGQVIVSEKKCVDYLWVGADAQHIRLIYHKPSQYTIRFFLTDPAIISVQIINSEHQTEAVLANHRVLNEGEHQLNWKLTPFIASGIYHLQLKVMATYSSRDRIQKIIRRSFRVSQN
jgi:hypothetical protein